MTSSRNRSANGLIDKPCERRENPTLRRQVRSILSQVIQQYSLRNAGGYRYRLLLLVDVNWKRRRLFQRC